jgi:hypothetical protein
MAVRGLILHSRFTVTFGAFSLRLQLKEHGYARRVKCKSKEPGYRVTNKVTIVNGKDGGERNRCVPRVSLD